MKMTRRILVLLLTLSLLLACFAIGASAYDASAENYDDILEFFETTEYVNVDFDGMGGKTYTEVFKDSDEKFEISATAANLKVVSDTVGDYLSVSQKAQSDFNLTVSKNTNFGMNFALYFPSTGTPVPKFALNAVVTGSSNTTKALFNINGTALQVWNGLDPNGMDQYVALTEIPAISAGTFYDFAMFCTRTNSGAKITLTVTDRSTGTTATAPEFYVDGFDPNMFALSFASSRQGNRAAATSYIDYIDIYEGNFPRSQKTKDVTVAQYIKEIYALYTENTEAEYAPEIINVIAKVVANYGYTTAGVTDATLKTEIDAIITVALKLQGDAYADALVNEIASIDPVTNTYNQRLDTANRLSVYSVFVDWVLENRTDITLSQTAADIAAAEESLTTEIETLAKLESDTLACIEAVNSISDANLASYAELYQVYDIVTTCGVCLTYETDTVTAEQVIAAAEACETIKIRFAALDADAKAFVQNVRIARDTENKTFLERYNAYMAVRDVVFDDTSYDAFIDGGVDTVDSLNADFAIVNAEMVAAIEIATEFLSKITTAESTNSFSVKAEALNEAVVIMESADFALIDGETGYPGIVAAKVKHAELLAAITVSENAAKAYIEAVIAIKNATTFAEKKAAVEAAKAISAGVDNVTISVFVMDGESVVDVKEANVMLSKADSEVKLIELNAANFKAAIAAYKAAKTTAERRATLKEANALMQIADDVIDGVAAAKTECASLVAAFAAEVASANTVAAKANSIASNASEAAMKAASGAKIIAIIKKFYE